jgi:O-antigen ligase
MRTISLFFEKVERYGDAAYRDKSLGGRIVIYKTALIALATHPILGVGVDRYQAWALTYEPKKRSDKPIQISHMPHNGVLVVASQQGLVGLIPYLAILILAYRDFSLAQRLARSRRDLRDPELEALYIRALMAQIGYLGILAVIMFQPGYLWRVMWTMIALSTVILSLTRKRLSELAEKAPVRSAEGPGTLLPGSFPQHVGALTRTPQQN